METPAAVEIEQGSLRRLLLDDFHKLLGKASVKNAPAFPQLPQRRWRRSHNDTFRKQEPKNADTRFRLIPVKTDAAKHRWECFGGVLAGEDDGLITADTRGAINGMGQAAAKLKVVPGPKNKVCQRLMEAI